MYGRRAVNDLAVHFDWVEAHCALDVTSQRVVTPAESEYQNLPRVTTKLATAVWKQQLRTAALVVVTLDGLKEIDWIKAVVSSAPRSLLLLTDDDFLSAAQAVELMNEVTLTLLPQALMRRLTGQTDAIRAIQSLRISGLKLGRGIVVADNRLGMVGHAGTEFVAHRSKDTVGKKIPLARFCGDLAASMIIRDEPVEDVVRLVMAAVDRELPRLSPLDDAELLTWYRRAKPPTRLVDRASLLALSLAGLAAAAAVVTFVR